MLHFHAVEVFAKQNAHIKITLQQPFKDGYCGLRLSQCKQTTESIRSCVRSYLAMRYYRFGNWYLQQVGGVPIVGCLSGVLLRLCLSRRESAFEKFTWPRTASTLHLEGSREDWTARHRYEDDILLGATRLCGGCIDALVKDVYAVAVPFDHTPENEVQQTTLLISSLTSRSPSGPPSRSVS